MIINTETSDERQEAFMRGLRQSAKGALVLEGMLAEGEKDKLIDS